MSGKLPRNSVQWVDSGALRDQNLQERTTFQGRDHEKSTTSLCGLFAWTGGVRFDVRCTTTVVSSEVHHRGPRAR